MNFLAPMFLFGAAAIAGPILFHLIRRSIRHQRPFSSLMFLRSSPPRLSRKHRLEHLPLLLLRCAALALLALGFARPFLVTTGSTPATAGISERLVILVDSSASMRREGLWDAARAAAVAQARNAGAGDAVALYTFDDRVQPLLSFAAWQSLPLADRTAALSARLDSVAPGWGGTQLGAALVSATEALQEGEGGASHRGTIVLISDVQSGSRMDGLQEYEWPQGVEVNIVPLPARHRTNVGIHVVGATPARTGAGPKVRVRLTNAGTSVREQFSIGWDSTNAASRVQAYVPPGQSRTILLPMEGQPGTRISVFGDDDPFDNSAHVVPPETPRASVLWLGASHADDPRSPLSFLRRAFLDGSHVAVDVRVAGAEAVSAQNIGDADLILVGGDIDAPTAGTLRQQVQAGKTVVVVLRNSTRESELGGLLGNRGISVSEASTPTYAMLAEIDFRHPLFAPFADPRFSDFTRIHVWRHRRIDLAGVPDARVLARFDTGDPAVVEVGVGTGRVIVFTTGWHPDDSQLAVSSKFVPLMWSLLEMSGAEVESRNVSTVGEALPLPARGATHIRPPGRPPVALPAGSTEYGDTREPGVYTFVSPAGELRHAVNLDPNESRTAPLEPGQLEQFAVPLGDRPTAASAERSAAALRAGELENRQKLWRWLIVAALVVVVAESLLAGRMTQRAVHATEAAS